MPQLPQPRAEKMAHLVARGMSNSAAYVEAGYKGSWNASRWSSNPEFKQRVEEIRQQDYDRTADISVHHRKWIDGEMRKLYDRCIQAAPLTSNGRLEGQEPGAECSECGNRTGTWWFDAKHAVKLLEMFGLEQGMFKRHLDVTSRKVTMVEGTQSEILEKFAQLLEKLGIAAMAQLFDRIGHENLVAAMSLIGYEVAKANGKDVELLDAASGGHEHAGESGEPDAQPVWAESEAAPVP